MEHPLLFGLSNSMNVLHWHGDEFATPDNALYVASSVACNNQAFLYREKVLGLQFHLEMDAPAIDTIIDACGHELLAGRNIQDAETIRSKSKDLDSYHALSTLLGNWINSHFITDWRTNITECSLCFLLRLCYKIYQIKRSNYARPS